MTRIERIGADLFGFIRDDPRLSASSAFYCRKHQLLTPYAQLQTDLG
jgi:hypothetical protein